MSLPFSPEPRGIGHWKFGIDLDENTAKYQLDVDAFIQEARERMIAIEEKITRDLVVEKLRELGYTVIPPKEES